jgi:hypothetical protein
MENEEPARSKFNWIETISIGALGICAVLFAKGIGMIVGRSTVQQFSSGYTEVSNENALTTGLNQAVKQLRTQVPIHVDEITTLSDAMVAGKEIIYKAVIYRFL